jgi:hypothetical protein
LVKDENGNLADFYNILNRWSNYFFCLLNVHSVSDGRQMEIHTAEPLVSDPNNFEVEIAIAELKKYKSSGSNQIAAELIQAGGETLQSEIHKLILFGVRRNCLISSRSPLLYQFTRKSINIIVVIIEEYHCYRLHTKLYSIAFS